jgi:FAD/FMN-containing dehydrogenase
MSAFNRVTVHLTEEADLSVDVGCNALVVAEAGCTTGEIIENAMAAGVIVPLGSRPSVGAGLWLQGGIGHLARMHGLACDAIVGAVLVSVDSSQVLCVGHVPSQHQPAGSVRPENEATILWALKGAGTNFGIVVKAICKAYTAPKYLVRSWVVSLENGYQAQKRLSGFEMKIASKLTRNYSADIYLYEEEGRLHLGVTMITSTTTMPFP